MFRDIRYVVDRVGVIVIVHDPDLIRVPRIPPGIVREDLIHPLFDRQRISRGKEALFRLTVLHPRDRITLVHLSADGLDIAERRDRQFETVLRNLHHRGLVLLQAVSYDSCCRQIALRRSLGLRRKIQNAAAVLFAPAYHFFARI